MKSIPVIACLVICLVMGTAAAKDARVSGDLLSSDRLEFEEDPDRDRCFEGRIKDTEKMRVLAMVNTLRSLHGLNPVVYDGTGDAAVQKAAFMIAVNRSLSHTPPSSWACWTPEGARGCNESVIFGGYGRDYTPRDALFGWIIDEGVESLGHRRWLLDPFLKRISYGQAVMKGYTGAVMKVVGVDEQPAGNVAFVAYPCGDYPRELFRKSWFLSFTVVQESSSRWKNAGIDYSAVSISMKGSDGSSLEVRSIKSDTSGFGVPNVLIWKADKIKDNVKYNVVIKGIGSYNKKRDYEYSFMLK